MTNSLQFAHYNTSTQAIVEPLSLLKLTNTTGITDVNTIWVNTATGKLQRGTTNIEGALGLVNTVGSMGMTPSGAATTGTFTLWYTYNSDTCTIQIVQNAPVAQVSLASTLLFTNSLPAAMCPSITGGIKQPVLVTNGAIQTMGWLSITTGGAVEIGSGPNGTFSGLLGNLFIYPTSITYQV